MTVFPVTAFDRHAELLGRLHQLATTPGHASYWARHCAQLWWLCWREELPPLHRSSEAVGVPGGIAALFLHRNCPR